MSTNKIIWREDPDLAAVGGEVARLNRVYGVVTEQASCCTWSVTNVKHVVISAGREGTFPAARKAAEFNMRQSWLARPARIEGVAP